MTFILKDDGDKFQIFLDSEPGDEISIFFVINIQNHFSK